MRQRKTIFYIIALAFTVCLSSGCNPIKQAGKRQAQFEDVILNYIKAHPPRIDTNTVYIPGKQVPVLVLDSTRLQQVKDSLQTALKLKYLADGQDCERQVNEAFETGKQAALFQFLNSPRNAPDTIKKTVYNTDVEDGYIRENANLKGQIAEQEKELQSSQKWLWLFIGSVALNAVLSFMSIKQLIKPKA